MVMALLRRLLAISVLVGVPLGSLWVIIDLDLPEMHSSPRVAGTEERPFVVGSERYREIYERNGNKDDRIRDRWGRIPFDLPSAAACLSAPIKEDEEPSTQTLAWGKINSLEALEVCLTRVLQRFDDDGPAIEWLRLQGFALIERLEPYCQGEKMLLGWSASAEDGPELLWQSLPWIDRFSSMGIQLDVTMCWKNAYWDEALLLTGEPPPYFRVLPRLSIRWPL